jgi:hypothetical protein
MEPSYRELQSSCPYCVNLSLIELFDLAALWHNKEDPNQHLMASGCKIRQLYRSPQPAVRTEYLCSPNLPELGTRVAAAMLSKLIKLTFISQILPGPINCRTGKRRTLTDD